MRAKPPIPSSHASWNLSLAFRDAADAAFTLTRAPDYSGLRSLLAIGFAVLASMLLAPHKEGWDFVQLDKGRYQRVHHVACFLSRIVPR